MKKSTKILAILGILCSIFVFIPKNSEAATSVSALQKQIASLNSQLASKNKQITSLNSQLSTDNKQITSLNSQLTSKSKQITSLNSQITSLKKQVATPSNSKFTYQSNTKTNSLINYQGNVYTRLDSLSSLLGLGLSYTKSNDTWYLGENTSGVMMSDLISPYAGENYAVNPYDGIDMVGVHYDKGYIYSIESGYTFPVDYNLQGKYSSIKGLLGYEDGTYGNNDFTGTVSFYGDGKLLKSFDIKTKDLPTSVEIPVKGVHKLEVTTNVKSTDFYSGYIALVNPKIY